MLCPRCGQDNASGMSFCGRCGGRLETLASEVATPDVPTSADFVGRQRELGELVSALDDAMSGKGRLVMLVGEPGIGKTRLAQELAGHCRAKRCPGFLGSMLRAARSTAVLALGAGDQVLYTTGRLGRITFRFRNRRFRHR